MRHLAHAFQRDGHCEGVQRQEKSRFSEKLNDPHSRSGGARMGRDVLCRIAPGRAFEGESLCSYNISGSFRSKDLKISLFLKFLRDEGAIRMDKGLFSKLKLVRNLTPAVL